MVWRRKTSDTFPRHKSDPEAEGQRRLKDEALFVRERRKALHNLPGPSDLSRFRKELYRDLEVGSTLHPLLNRIGWSMEEFLLHWNWAPSSWFLNNSEFSLIWQVSQNALTLFGLYYKAGLADMPDCSTTVAKKKRLSTLSTTASEFVRFGITSENRWSASNPSSSCCSTLVAS